jgi:nucleoside-triphosphatase THEP1
MNYIYILKGQVESGKTTNLKAWSERQQNVDGILAPVVEGRRHLYRLKSKELRLLESDANDANSVKIGRHFFNEEVFRWGRNQLKDAANDTPEWLIIDEIGPLELKGNGLEPVVGTLINNIQNRSFRLLLVVRETLVPKVIDYYKLEPDLIKLITLSELKYLD